MPEPLIFGRWHTDMATNPDVIDDVVEQVALGDRFTQKKMFGEYVFYAFRQLPRNDLALA